MRARSWHLLVFYGWWMLVGVTLWVMIAEWTRPSLFAGLGYRAISLLAEAGGLFLLLGACLALFSTPTGMSPGRRAERSAVFAMLIVLVGTGFLLEGVRFRLQGDPYPAWSPVGAGVSHLLRPVSEAWALSLFPGLWWLHSLLALLFVAWIPFSRSLRHLVFLVPHRAWEPVEPRVPLPEADLLPSAESDPAPDGVALRLGIETADDTTPRQRLGVLSCMECARCDAVCPAHQTGQPLSPRTFLGGFREHVLGRGWGDALGLDRRGRQLQAVNPLEHRREMPAGRGLRRVMDDLDPMALWTCRTCLACEEVCPAGIGHVSQIIELRRAEVLHHGRLPQKAAAALRNLARTGNPYGSGPEEKQAWLRRHGAGLGASGERDGRLLWIGCFPPGDLQKPRVLECLVSLLNRSGVPFFLPPESVSCCGEPARVLGDEDLFRRQAVRQARWIRDAGVREILVHCPHCRHTLEERCSGMRPPVAVVHTSELFRDAIRRGGLKPSAVCRPGTTGYHDPCFLGRYHATYAPVREILRSISGGGLLEPENTRERSFCCGAGGGHFFMDLDTGERPATRRLGEFISCGAETVAVSCPFCFSMLDDACRRLPAGEEPRVVDWLELLQESVETP